MKIEHLKFIDKNLSAEEIATKYVDQLVYIINYDNKEIVANGIVYGYNFNNVAIKNVFYYRNARQTTHKNLWRSDFVITGSIKNNDNVNGWRADAVSFGIENLPNKNELEKLIKALEL